MVNSRYRSQWNKSFDVKSEIELVEKYDQLRKKKPFRRSVIDCYRGELSTLYNGGLSFAQLSLWLKHRKRITVSRTAIYRRMREWPEVRIRGGK